MISHKFLGVTYTDDKGLKWLFVRPTVYQGYPAYFYRQVPAEFQVAPPDAVYVPVGQKKSVSYEEGYTAATTPAAIATPMEPVVTIPTSNDVTISDTPPFPVETVIETITNKDKVLGLCIMAGVGLTFAYWLKHH